MTVKRIPLQVDLKARDTVSEKDSLITNGYIEQSPSGNLFTVKRPGVQVGSAGAGAASGAFVYNDILYYWDSFSNPLIPYSYSIWLSTHTYAAGNTVFYPGGPWTAVTPILGTPPSYPNWTTALGITHITASINYVSADPLSTGSVYFTSGTGELTIVAANAHSLTTELGITTFGAGLLFYYDDWSGITQSSTIVFIPGSLSGTLDISKVGSNWEIKYNGVSKGYTPYQLTTALSAILDTAIYNIVYS